MDPVTMFAPLATQLGLGAVGLIVLMWAWSKMETERKRVDSVYEARIADIKEMHKAQMRLLAKVLKIPSDEETV